MKFCTVRDLRINASKVIRQARRQRVVVTVRGRPTAVIVPLSEEDFDGIDIDLYPELKESLIQGDAEITRTGGIPFSVVKERLKRRG